MPRRLIPAGLVVVAGLFGWSGGAMSNPAVSVAPPFYRGRSPVYPILHWFLAVRPLVQQASQLPLRRFRPLRILPNRRRLRRLPA
jgi:hypothetical protein